MHSKITGNPRVNLTWSDPRTEHSRTCQPMMSQVDNHPDLERCALVGDLYFSYGTSNT